MTTDARFRENLQTLRLALPLISFFVVSFLTREASPFWYAIGIMAWFALTMLCFFPPWRKRDERMIPTDRPPTHPGEIVFEMLLMPQHLTPDEAAECLGISETRLDGLLEGKRRITPRLAVRLAKRLNTTPRFWLNLQANYDAYEAQHGQGARRVSAAHQ